MRHYQIRAGLYLAAKVFRYIMILKIRPPLAIP